MTKEQAEKLFEKIQMLGRSGQVSLNEKETDVLGRVLNSDPMVKGLAILYSEANAAPTAFITANLEDPVQRQQATQLQGKIAGVIGAIQHLLTLATESDETGGDES